MPADQLALANAAFDQPGVVRRSALAYDEFRDEYCVRRIPVVLVDAISGWAALTKWNPGFFRTRFGMREVKVREERYTSGTSGPQDRKFLLGDLIDLIEKSTDRAPAPYLRNQSVPRLSPELDEDLRPRPEYFFPNWIEGRCARRLHVRLDYDGPELHLGGLAAAFPSLHYDYCHVHTFLAQIYGEKKVILFSPDQSKLLYPEAEFKHGSLIPDIDHVDLKRFPKFAQATPTTVILEPGEVLFIPAGWWHTTRLLSTSIGVSFEHANETNWSDLSRECRYMMPFLPALKMTAYLTFLRMIRGAVQLVNSHR